MTRKFLCVVKPPADVWNAVCERLRERNPDPSLFRGSLDHELIGYWLRNEEFDGWVCDDVFRLRSLPLQGYGARVVFVRLRDGNERAPVVTIIALRDWADVNQPFFYEKEVCDMNESRLLSIPAAARWAGCSRELIDLLIQSGRLKTVRPNPNGGHRKVVFDSLQQFVDGGTKQ